VQWLGVVQLLLLHMSLQVMSYVCAWPFPSSLRLLLPLLPLLLLLLLLHSSHPQAMWSTCALPPPSLLKHVMRY
jgi:hypothetical protein